MQNRILAGRLRTTTKSVLLLGPRQVGKSTLCRSMKPDKTINLADESLFIRYAKDPSLLKKEVLTLPKPSLIFIDEVQRIPTILNTVQMLIDESSGGYRFLLTGSSARKLKRGEANLLPGRVILEYLDPLSFFEVSGQFELDRALQVGMLPEIFLNQNEGIEILSAYSEIYLKEEIQAEALIKNIGSYARFLDVAAILSGQWLNYSKVSSETEIPKETIRRFFSILEETLLIFRIPAFQPKLKISRRVAQKDKFLFFELGVRNSLLGLHRNPVTQDHIGSLFEQWLILQIIYLNRALKKNWHFSSYRTEGGAEVDLVIERDQDIIGIEIKSGTNVGASDTRGLSSLADTIGNYKPFQKWIAYRGTTTLILDQQVKVFPYLTLLDALKE